MKASERSQFAEERSPVPGALRGDSIASLRGVSRYFEGPALVRALTNVHLDIYRGEVFGLLGPRGSGKSTALRILAGALSASEGKVRVFGRSPRRRAVRTRIGYLPGHDRHAPPALVARARAFLRVVLAGKQRAPAAVDARAGVHRRAQLTQMLLKSPDLVLLDDLFHGLDPAGCGEMKELIVTLSNRGKTVILTSDSLWPAMDICHRLAIFHGGTIEATGTTEEFLAAPGALRLIGDLLPPATAVRALQVLGEDLRARRAPGAVLPERSVDSRQGACEQVPTEPGGPVATRDTLLTPLVKGTSSELSQAAPTKASAEVNHDLLASLTKTDPGTLPPDQKGT